jgi:hypothetical protein
MGVITLEGIVEQGQIKLTGDVCLPEQTKVYVVVPDAPIKQSVHVRSPHLAYPEQAADFALEVVESSPDARL